MEAPYSNQRNTRTFTRSVFIVIFAAVALSIMLYLTVGMIKRIDQVDGNLKRWCEFLAITLSTTSLIAVIPLSIVSNAYENKKPKITLIMNIVIMVMAIIVITLFVFQSALIFKVTSRPTQPGEMREDGIYIVIAVLILLPVSVCELIIAILSLFNVLAANKRRTLNA